MTVTDDFVFAELTTVFLHDLFLFFRRMGHEFSDGTFYVMLRCQFGIPRRLGTIEGGPTEIGLFPILAKF